MSQPIVVTLPHQLGKAEALRRLQASFSGDPFERPRLIGVQEPMVRVLANKAKALVQKQGKLMLEKPAKPSNTRN